MIDFRADISDCISFNVLCFNSKHKTAQIILKNSHPDHCGNALLF